MSRSIRTFYILLITQTFSLIGSQMTGLAIGIKVFDDTGKVMPLALTTFFYAIPLIAAAGLAGLVADRWDRRWVLITADAGQALGTVFLLWSFTSGNFQLWHLYLLSFVQALFSIFQHPAFQASVTMLIPDEQRDRANAIQQLTSPTAGIVAPVLGGFLFAAIGVSGIITIDLITFVIAVIVVLLIRIPRPAASAEGQQARTSIWKETTAGFAVLRARRLLFTLILFITFANFLWNIFAVLRTPYLLTFASSAEFGTLLGVGSAGLMAGGLLMSVWKIDGGRVRVLLLAIIAIGAFMTPLGILRALPLLALVLFFGSVPHPVVNTLLTSLLQLKTPPDMQGRVFAALAQLVLLSTPFALLLGGLLADYVLEPAVGTPGWALVTPLVGNQPGAGMGLLMFITGIAYTLAALVLYRWKPMRNLETTVPDYHPIAEG